MVIGAIDIGWGGMVAVLVIIALLLLVFPKAARELYIWSKEIIGIDVSAKSPMLSDDAIRFWGILHLVFAAIVALIAWSTAGT